MVSPGQGRKWPHEAVLPLAVCFPVGGTVFLPFAHDTSLRSAGLRPGQKPESPDSEFLLMSTMEGETQDRLETSLGRLTPATSLA